MTNKTKKIFKIDNNTNKFIYVLLTAIVGLCIFIKKIWKHKKGKLGLIITLSVIFIAIFAPVLTPYNPYDFDVKAQLQKGSIKHLLGTDKNGVDILSQVLYGTRISLIIGIVTGLCVTIVGAVLGIMAGYFGKVASFIIMNLINVLMVIPTLPLMIILNKVSSSYIMLIFVFVAFGWTGTARTIRAQVLSLKNANYVKAAELAGANRWYIMLKHILPAVSHLLIMNCALSCAGFMVAEAGLSFIGLGDPSVISWGKILVSAQESAFSSGLWAWVIAPGVAIFITVTGFMNVGFAVEEIFNPRMRAVNTAGKAFENLTEKDVTAAYNEMQEIAYEDAKKILEEYNMGENNSNDK